MRADGALSHEFVEYIPKDLKDGTVYVSVPFATAAHRCFCGCGNEVVTPLSPTDWTLTFDGDSISLDPSVGNWSFACQSHYWIRRNRVKWAARWSRREIEAQRSRDRWAKDDYFDGAKVDSPEDAKEGPGESQEIKGAESLWQRLRKRWF